MKTKILSIAIILLTVFSTSSKTFASSKNDGAATMLTGISNINQIEVHGNVELYVSSGETDKVKVYDSYYNQNALVQEQNGVLRISSYKTEKLVVWVTVDDLQAISVYDNAIVKSYGKLSALELTVSVNNNASAQLNMDCYKANIAVNDNAKADITGYADQTNVIADQSATVNAAGLVATTTIQKRKATVMATKSVLDELAAN